MVSNIVYFHPYLGKISNLANIFQIGWNHQATLCHSSALPNHQPGMKKPSSLEWGCIQVLAVLMNGTKSPVIQRSVFALVDMVELLSICSRFSSWDWFQFMSTWTSLGYHIQISIRPLASALTSRACLSSWGRSMIWTCKIWSEWKKRSGHLGPPISQMKVCWIKFRCSWRMKEVICDAKQCQERWMDRLDIRNQSLDGQKKRRNISISHTESANDGVNKQSTSPLLIEPFKNIENCGMPSLKLIVRTFGLLPHLEPKRKCEHLEFPGVKKVLFDSFL